MMKTTQTDESLNRLSASSTFRTHITNYITPQMGNIVSIAFRLHPRFGQKITKLIAPLLAEVSQSPFGFIHVSDEIQPP